MTASKKTQRQIGWWDEGTTNTDRFKITLALCLKQKAEDQIRQLYNLRPHVIMGVNERKIRQIYLDCLWREAYLNSFTAKFPPEYEIPECRDIPFPVAKRNLRNTILGLFLPYWGDPIPDRPASKPVLNANAFCSVCDQYEVDEEKSTNSDDFVVLPAKSPSPEGPTIDIVGPTGDLVGPTGPTNTNTNAKVVFDLLEGKKEKDFVPESGFQLFCHMQARYYIDHTISDPGNRTINTWTRLHNAWRQLRPEEVSYYNDLARQEKEPIKEPTKEPTTTKSLKESYDWGDFSTMASGTSSDSESTLADSLPGLLGTGSSLSSSMPGLTDSTDSLPPPLEMSDSSDSMVPEEVSIDLEEPLDSVEVKSVSPPEPGSLGFLSPKSQKKVATASKITVQVNPIDLVKSQKFNQGNRKTWIQYVTNNCTDVESFMRVIDYGFALHEFYGLMMDEKEKETANNNEQKIIENYLIRAIELDLMDVFLALDMPEWEPNWLYWAIEAGSFRIATYLSRKESSLPDQVVRKMIELNEWDLIKSYLSNVYVTSLDSDNYDEILKHEDFHQIMIDQEFDIKRDVIKHFSNNEEWDKLKKFVNRHL